MEGLTILCNRNPLQKKPHSTFPTIVLAKVLILALTLAGCAKELAQDLGLARSDEPGGIPYEVKITGAPDEEMEELLLLVSALAGDDPPALVTSGLIRRRAEEDIPNLLKALHSRGYYKAEMQVEVSEGKPPLDVNYTVIPGPRFTLAQVRILVDAEPEYKAGLPSPQELGMEIGQGFRSEWVPEAQKRIRQALASQGYPFAEAAYEAVADFASNSMHITFTVQPGPFARFGETAIAMPEGLDLSPDYVRSKLPWKPGEAFDAQALAQARNNLLGTGLFSYAQFAYPEQVGENEELPLRLELRERPPRTVRAGGTYSTDLGPGVELGWEHRNLLGEGESLSVGLEANFVNRILESTYREPFFLFRENQSLILTARAADEQPEAYRSQSIDLSGVVERYIFRRTRIAGGLGFTLLNVDDPISDQDNYALFYLPLLIARDTRDNILDPGGGSLLSADGAPYYEVFGESNWFFKYTTNAQFYWSLMDEKRLILATRARFGQIPGQELSTVPATIRFYAGGGGSVRGYEYKTLSTLVDGDPVGGRSLLETSAELRWRFLDDWGLVTFLDGGRAYTDIVPDFKETYFWGTGLGVRYYTDFGPIRADLAFPLNRREEFDSHFQFYISIGQSF